ncbi:MAG: hypothetical protein R3296_08810 [Oleiphilaceae bacterium]|nr:hypothetical protein [Oleiphilaceae bacterium]
MTDEKSVMEKIRQGMGKNRESRRGGGFPWLLLGIVALVVLGMAFRGL